MVYAWILAVIYYQKGQFISKMNIDAYSNIQHLQLRWVNKLLRMILFISITTDSVTMLFCLSTHILLRISHCQSRHCCFVRSHKMPQRWRISIIIATTPPKSPYLNVELWWLIVVICCFHSVVVKDWGRAWHPPHAATRHHNFCIKR